MKEKIIKNAFVTGNTVFIDGKPYTKMFTKEEVELLKNSPVRTQQELDAMDKRMDKAFRETNPELYKKTYGDK